VNKGKINDMNAKTYNVQIEYLGQEFFTVETENESDARYIALKEFRVRNPEGDIQSVEVDEV